MASDKYINLASNGEYWQAWWYNSLGKRKRRSLGPKSALSERAALKMCQTIAIELHLNPGRRDAHLAPRLGDYLGDYLDSRTEIRRSTRSLYTHCADLMKEHFGEDLPIDQIDRKAARGWRTWIAKRPKPGVSRDEQVTITESTVRKMIRQAKAIFGQAVDDELIAYNPFDRLLSAPLEPDKGSWRYITLNELDKIIDVCPSHGWTCLVALCRLAGLRVGEAQRVEWADVQWEAARLTVVAPTSTRTTKHRTRTVPVEPRLMTILTAAFEAADPGADQVCDIASNNTRRDLHVIIKRAGLTPWTGLLQAMRRNRDTDWAKEYPGHVCAEWMGHSEAVARRYYQDVTDDQFDKAAGKNQNSRGLADAAIVQPS